MVVGVGHLDARAPDLFRGREHLGRAADDLLAFLVDAQAVEDHALVLGILLDAGDRHRDRVAQRDGPREAQGLVEVDGAGAGQLGAQHRGDERAAPHAVAHHLVEEAFLGPLGIDVGGVHVGGHDGEELDVFGPEHAGELGTGADLEFVEGDVLHQAVIGGGVHDGVHGFLVGSGNAGDCCGAPIARISQCSIPFS